MYEWHRCDNCGHQCPHEGEFCRCPWCRWSHKRNTTTFRLDPRQDGDGVSRNTLMTEFECRMATIAGLLRLVSGRAGITYKGEQSVRMQSNPSEVVRALCINYEERDAIAEFAVDSVTTWQYMQDYIPALGALGTIHSGEDLAA